MAFKKRLIIETCNKSQRYLLHIKISMSQKYSTFANRNTNKKLTIQ